MNKYDTLFTEARVAMEALYVVENSGIKRPLCFTLSLAKYDENEYSEIVREFASNRITAQIITAHYAEGLRKELLVLIPRQNDRTLMCEFFIICPYTQR